MTPIDIIFENNHLLVLNKPANLLTQPSGTEQDSLEQRAKNWIKQRDHKPGQVFLEAVHRLDKPVSGVTIFGKTSKALARLNESIRNKQTVKIYWAWVEGHPTQKEAILEHALLHDEFQARVVSCSHKEAKLARLSYREIERYSHYSLLEITLETGRYHQIRAQLAAIDHPILNDVKYGGQLSLDISGIALHHRKLEIPDPISKQMLCFEAPIPSYFK